MEISLEALKDLVISFGYLHFIVYFFIATEFLAFILDKLNLIKPSQVISRWTRLIALILTALALFLLIQEGLFGQSSEELKFPRDLPALIIGFGSIFLGFVFLLYLISSYLPGSLNIAKRIKIPFQKEPASSQQLKLLFIPIIISLVVGYVIFYLQEKYLCFGIQNCRVWGNFDTIELFHLIIGLAIGTYLADKVRKIQKQTQRGFPIFYLIIVLIYFSGIFFFVQTYAKSFGDSLQLSISKLDSIIGNPGGEDTFIAGTHTIFLKDVQAMSRVWSPDSYTLGTAGCDVRIYLILKDGRKILIDGFGNALTGPISLHLFQEKNIPMEDDPATLVWKCFDTP